MNTIQNIIGQAEIQNTTALRSFLIANSSTPLIVVGSGGMTGVAEHVATLYTSHSGLGRAMTPLEMNSLSDETLAGVKILLLSKSGHNNDIVFAARRALEVNPSETACMCLREGERNDLKPIFEKAGCSSRCFIFETDAKDGFVSCGSPLMYLAIITKAFGELGLVETGASVNLTTNGGETLSADNFKKVQQFTILSAGWGKSVTDLLEGKFVEWGWASAQTADFRNYCHGRFIFTSNHLDDSAVVMLVTPREKSLAARTRGFLPLDTKLILVESELDSSASALDLLIGGTDMFHTLAEAAGVNPDSPKNPGRIDKRKPINIPFMADLKKVGPLTTFVH